MKPTQLRPRAALLALPLAFLLTLAGCDADPQRSPVTAPATKDAAEATRSTRSTAAAELEQAAAQAATLTEKAAEAGGEAASKVADQAVDALITAKVSTGLAIDKTLRASPIEVATRAGVVTLKGPAPTAAARARAEEIARNVQGVTAVENRLSVQSG